MAEAATIARPYAKAAFEAAREHAEFGAWSEALAKAAGLAADPRVATAFTSPKLGVADFVRFFDGLTAQGCADRWRNFVRVLAENKRLAAFPQIASQFDELRETYENEISVEITAAVPVDAPQTEQLRRALEQRLQRRVRIGTTVDARILGGAVIRAGDLVIDGSLTGRLKRLASELAS